MISTVIYDCEIVKAILGKGEKVRVGIEYCSGFDDFANMGISVICAYEYQTGRYRVFLKDNFAAFALLVDQADVLIGWNNSRFDDPLIKEALGIVPRKSYDLRAEIAARHKDGKYMKGSLGDFGCINGCGEKYGSGELAPIMWQRGSIGSVVDYCLQDVRITKGLIDKLMGVVGTGRITCPGGYDVLVTKPW